MKMGMNLLSVVCTPQVHKTCQFVSSRTGTYRTRSGSMRFESLGIRINSPHHCLFPVIYSELFFLDCLQTGMTTAPTPSTRMSTSLLRKKGFRFFFFFFFFFFMGDFLDFFLPSLEAILLLCIPKKGLEPSLTSNIN